MNESNDLIITPVKTNIQLDEFVSFPYELHKGVPNWIPPVKKQELELLSTHPFWDTASKELFLARRGDKIVGRIAAIVDEKYNAYADQTCGAFGFFECENDSLTAHTLLYQARDWLAQKGMTFMRGPLNPSTNYTCGILVDGFNKAPGIMMPWNPPYYPELLESWPMYKEEDLFAYHIEKNALQLPDWLKNELERIRAENRFTFRSSSKKTMQADVRAMLAIYRESWAKNWGFSPLSEAEASKLAHDLGSILNPEFFILFFDGDLPVAGMVALPNLNPLLKRLNGKIGLLSPWHYFRSRGEIAKSFRIMLFGILPQYRLLGLPLLLLDAMLEKARQHPDMEWIEGSWVLEDNYAIDSLIEDFSGKIRKRYRIYRRDITPCQT